MIDSRECMPPEYINSHEPVYNYLLRYFLPDLSDPYFRQAAAQEIEQDERMTYCRYMAAWLPHESHYDEILKRIAGAAQCANDKEDAAETGILFHHTLCCSIHWTQSSTLSRP